MYVFHNHKIYIFFSDDFLLVKVDMKHHLLWWYVAVVRKVSAKCQKDCFRFPGFLCKNSFFGLRVSFVECNNMLSFSFVLVALDIANKYEFRILGFINSSPLSFKDRLAFLHDMNIIFWVEQLKSIQKKESRMRLLNDILIKLSDTKIEFFIIFWLPQWKYHKNRFKPISKNLDRKLEMPEPEEKAAREEKSKSSAKPWYWFLHPGRQRQSCQEHRQKSWSSPPRSRRNQLLQRWQHHPPFQRTWSICLHPEQHFHRQRRTRNQNHQGSSPRHHPTTRTQTEQTPWKPCDKLSWGSWRGPRPGGREPKSKYAWEPWLCGMINRPYVHPLTFLLNLKL